jgi:hypothetical protein
VGQLRWGADREGRRPGWRRGRSRCWNHIDGSARILRDTLRMDTATAPSQPTA